MVSSSRSSCRSSDGETGLVKGVNDILEVSDGTPKIGGHGSRIFGKKIQGIVNRKMGKREKPVEVWKLLGRVSSQMCEGVEEKYTGMAV